MPTVWRMRHDTTPKEGVEKPNYKVHQKCHQCQVFREKKDFEGRHRNKTKGICRFCAHAMECSNCGIRKHADIHFTKTQRVITPPHQRMCNQCRQYYKEEAESRDNPDMPPPVRAGSTLDDEERERLRDWAEEVEAPEVFVDGSDNDSDY